MGHSAPARPGLVRAIAEVLAALTAGALLGAPLTILIEVKRHLRRASE